MDYVFARLLYALDKSGLTREQAISYFVQAKTRHYLTSKKVQRIVIAAIDYYYGAEENACQSK